MAGQVGRRIGDTVMERDVPVAVELPPGLVVVVLGQATAVVTGALWGAGLRPVRGQRYGTVWTLPKKEGR